MSLLLHAPCSRIDLGEVYGDVSVPVWLAICRQIELGPSFAVRDAGARAVACGGFIPLGDCWENWFHAAPAAAASMRQVLAFARLTLAELPQCDPRPIEAVVRTRAGGRIARALGFQRAVLVDGIEIWRIER